MARLALPFSGKTLATTGKKTLATKPGQVLFPSEKRVSGKTLATVPAKKGELATTKTGKSTVKGKKGETGDSRVSGGREPGKEETRESESGSTSEEKRKAKGVVRSSAVVEMLVSLGVSPDEAEEMALSAQLSQSNPRLSTSGPVNRRDGGAGFGRGSGSGGKTRRARSGEAPAPAQTRRMRETPALPAPASRPALPAPASRPALPAPASRPALPSPGKMGLVAGGQSAETETGEDSAEKAKEALLAVGKKGLAAVGKESIAEIAGNAEAALTEAGKMNPIAAVASQALQSQKADAAKISALYAEARKLWKEGKFEESVRVTEKGIRAAEESTLNPGFLAARMTNWIRDKIKKV